ncbi:MAG: DPP IV N-terminal domain-containing protein [Prevotella sp.]|nr:DPP IV N-terminal domain-containing protein [Prevotella sp.]
MTKIKSLLFLFILSLPMLAQDKQFTLEDLNFGGTNYRNLLPENKWLTWWGDELIRTDIEECYLVDKKTGQEKVLFTLDDINRWSQSDDNNRVRHLHSVWFPYADQPIVAVRNSHSFTLIDFKHHNIVWQDTISGSLANNWSPASKATAYVEDDQLFVLDAQGHKHQLTTDGSRDIVYGQAVHRNEFGIMKGTFWSPDGQRLAFYRMDQTQVADYPQVDIFGRIATCQPDKYPMAGEASHTVTIGIYDLPTGRTLYLNTPAETSEGFSPVYFSNITWSPDGTTLYLFELNRDQNDCRLVAYDARTGSRLSELDRETSPKYVEPLNPIVFLPWDSNLFILQSQRDGYNHLYLYNKQGQLQRQLTSGNFVVQQLLGFNEKERTAIITSNEAHPLQHNTYSVDLKTGRRLLLDNGRGSHHAELSKSGQWFYDRYSEPTVPRCIDVATTSKPKRKAVTGSTRLLTAADPWADYQQPLFESGTIKAADGITDLYYRMVKPHDFDPAKKYPTVVYVYGGPHAHNVEASWHWYSRSWETYMAQRGYILFILDNRGSENRGRDFEQVTFRQLGQVEMQDQMKGVDFLRSLPYVDMNRLGVHGWSFGGFMTISLMLNYPDIFKVGVAGGPVIDWKWYEVMYGERYMDTPQQNPEGYAKTSLIDKAANLKGRLQIITGYNDQTVVPQHCLSFLDACVKAETQPDFFAYPGEEHNMRGHASVHLHERITRYFDDYLK